MEPVSHGCKPVSLGELELAQVGLENPASAGVLQAADGFLLDLSHAFTCEVKPFSNFLQCQRVFTTQSKVEAHHICFSACERLKGAFNLFAQ